MSRHSVVVALCTWSVALALGACGGGGDAASNCTSASTTGPCTGSFTCGNETIPVTCDSQLQVCVITGGQANCVTVDGTGSACPSEADAESLSGCAAGETATCSGTSSTGITVTCE